MGTAGSHARLIIPDALKRANSDATDNQLLDMIIKYISANMKNSVSHGGATFKSACARIRTLNSVLKLTPESFDSRGDFQFPCSSGDRQVRGGIPYYQPDSSWFRVGLKVLDLYPGNNDWMSMGRGSWVTAFHGTQAAGVDAMRAIASQRTLLRGTRNMFANRKASNRDDPIPAFGIYLSLKIETCYRGPFSLTDGKYDVAFQCRVHPEHVWIIENPTHEGWIVVDQPLYIRPYGVVMRKV